MRVLLKCDENRLFGFGNGRDLYLCQLSNVLTYRYKVTIVFPINVADISLSFIDGFMSEVYKHISKEDVIKYLIIDGNSRVVDKFNKYYKLF